MSSINSADDIRFFQSINRRETPPVEPPVLSARDYFSGYPKDNAGGTICNVRIFKTTIEEEHKALVVGRVWVVPTHGKPGKVFTFEHSLTQKNNVWHTETLRYNYVPNK